MKITHSDTRTALKFQWTCISCMSNSQRGKRQKNDDTGLEQRVPRSRFLHAACLQGHHLYILGGKDRYSPLKDMWRLNTVSSTWEQIRDIETKIPHLQGHSMLTYKSQLLIFGGTFYDSEDTPLWIYNTDLNHVRQFCCEAGCVAPVGRREHSAVIYKNSMYIYGGFLDNSGSTDEFWAFKIQEEEWRLIRRHKPGKRHGHVAVVAGNNMWLHGGMKGLTALSDLWVFNFVMCTWNKVKGLGTSPTLSNHTAHVVNDLLLLFGGSKLGSPAQDVWSFKFETSSWRQISLQHGDIYPPISLHTSVLLSSSVVAHGVSYHTKSVPQLKGKTLGVDQDMVRPWTSSASGSDRSALSHHTACISSHPSVDILCLKTYNTNLDSNNNKSEESINIESPPSGLEGETSFGNIAGRDSIHNHPRTRDTNVWLTDTSKNPNVLSYPDSSAQPKVPTRKRIGSGPGEHCDDDQPLLQRFHSVVSDTDYGENNLTLTLSSEDVHHKPEVSSKMEVEQSERVRGYMNPVVFRDHISSEALQDKVQNEQFLAGRQHAMWTSEMKNDNSMEMDVFAGPNRNRQNWNPSFSESVIQKGKDNVITRQSSSFRRGVVGDVKFVNPVYEKLFNQGIETCMDSLNGATMNLRAAEETGGQVFSPWTEQENIPPTSNCLNDLVVEDLETCDIGQLFQHTEVADPPSHTMYWSSLKSLIGSDDKSHEDLTYAPTPEKHRRQVRSCGNLTSCVENESLTDSAPLETSLSKENYSFSDLLSTSVKPRQPVGKYIKHSKLGAGRSINHLHKSKYDSRMLSDPAESDHIAMQSIGTQTTGSQISLGNTVLASKASRTVANYDHFVTNATADTKVYKDQMTTSELGQQAESGGTRKSVLGDAELCVLIIGGQTEHASLHREPLKIWHCTVY